MLGTIAQFETEFRAERQLDGSTQAEAHGMRFGRSKELTLPQIVALQDRGAHSVRIKTLMQDYHLSKASVYRSLSTPGCSRSAPDPSVL